MLLFRRKELLFCLYLQLYFYNQILNRVLQIRLRYKIKYMLQAYSGIHSSYTRHID